MIKKDKIFELKIEEDDDISGIDSISLVSEPAIEINWVAFNKEKDHEFHVPDGEDNKYLEMLLAKGRPESELLEDGWVLVSQEEIVGHNFGLAATKPNLPSVEDTEEYRVRFKYGLNPSIRESEIIPTTREYCRTLLNKNYVWSYEEILTLPPNQDPTDGGWGGQAMTWRGGYNCRHRWFKMLYKKEGKIVNKASININKVKDDAGRADLLTPDFIQEDTITEKTKKAVKEDRAAPTTAKNLGLSKEKFQENILDVFGYKTKHFDMCPGAVELFKHLVSMPLEQEDLTGMIRSAAVIADNIFKIEKDVITAQQGSLEQLHEATVLVDDFKDIIHEVDEDTGMIHDVSFMDGHILKIAQYVDEELGYDVGALPAYVDEIGTGTTEDKMSFEKVSIDYDDTLSTDRGKSLALRLKREGNDVYIVTRRQKIASAPVFRDAQLLGIPKDKIFFTEGRLKWETLKRLGIQRHYDNNPDEINAIKKNAPLIRAIAFAEEKFETYNDYPEAAKNNACKVLKWREEHGDEVKGMTRVGWTRANQLCKGENISEETIARMSAFQRHRKNAEVSPEFKDTPWKDAGYVAWLGWGGTTGVEWASRKLETIRRRKMSIQRFATDEEQRVTIGPAMVPDLKIFRKDHLGNPYYVVFRADTIKMIAEKYMRNKYLDNNDTNHDGVAVRDVYVVESWIKEDEEDKANKYGFADLPVGTWFVKMKVAKTPEGDKVWEKIKSGDLRGYSVSGFFAEEPIEMQKEMLFLHKVAEILRNVGKD